MGLGMRDVACGTAEKRYTESVVKVRLGYRRCLNYSRENYLCERVLRRRNGAGRQLKRDYKSLWGDDR